MGKTAPGANVEEQRIKCFLDVCSGNVSDYKGFRTSSTKRAGFRMLTMKSTLSPQMQTDNLSEIFAQRRALKDDRDVGINASRLEGVFRPFFAHGCTDKQDRLTAEPSLWHLVHPPS